MLRIDFLPKLIWLAALLGAAFFTFARVRKDYQAYGRLTKPISSWQLGYFVVYALSSYIFLDSRLSTIKTDGWQFPVAILLMGAGLLIVLGSMPFLGEVSFGHKVENLQTTGLYHFSRNPQLVGSFLFIAGYCWLWPAWMGVAYASLWLVISYWMVGAEEQHLESIYGDEYRQYCARTPRWLGIPKRSSRQGKKSL